MTLTTYLVENTTDRGQRRSARRKLRLQTHGSRTDGKLTPILLHDISASGLLIESQSLFDSGEKIDIELPHAGVVCAIVIWSSGNFFGCQFEAPISVGTLSAVQLRSLESPEKDASTAQDEDEPETFGMRIRRIRKDNGLTQTQLATQLGVSMPAVCAWEKGHSRPRDTRMQALADILGTSISELVGPAKPASLQELLSHSREQIAEFVGTSSDKIRIIIET
jgi:transcriptional regulator with XRE-family HTH domain